jgi:hypothetical protein
MAGLRELLAEPRTSNRRAPPGWVLALEGDHSRVVTEDWRDGNEEFTSRQVVLCPGGSASSVASAPATRRPSGRVRRPARAFGAPRAPKRDIEAAVAACEAIAAVLQS